jgi:hypothetical protein
MHTGYQAGNALIFFSYFYAMLILQGFSRTPEMYKQERFGSVNSNVNKTIL